MAQAVLDLDRKIVGRRKLLEGGQELAARIAEPRFKELVQPLPLIFDFLFLRIANRDHRRARLAKDIDVRQSLAVGPRFDRAQYLVRRPARIGLSGRQFSKVFREFGSQPTSEDANHEVAILRLGNLILEGLVGGIV
ncbi:MAG: hypothetical protein ABSC25_06265 [Roseiarcus sp.]